MYSSASRSRSRSRNGDGSSELNSCGSRLRLISIFVVVAEIPSPLSVMTQDIYLGLIRPEFPASKPLSPQHTDVFDFKYDGFGHSAIPRKRGTDSDNQPEQQVAIAPDPGSNNA